MILFNPNRDMALVMPGVPILYRSVSGRSEAIVDSRPVDEKIRVRFSTGGHASVPINCIEEIGEESNYGRWVRLTAAIRAGDLIEWDGPPEHPIGNNRHCRGTFCHIAKGGHLVLRPLGFVDDRHIRLAPRKVLRAYRWDGGKFNLIFR